MGLACRMCTVNSVQLVELPSLLVVEVAPVHVCCAQTLLDQVLFVFILFAIYVQVG